AWVSSSNVEDCDEGTDMLFCTPFCGAGQPSNYGARRAAPRGLVRRCARCDKVPARQACPSGPPKSRSGRPPQCRAPTGRAVARASSTGASEERVPLQENFAGVLCGVLRNAVVLARPQPELGELKRHVFPDYAVAHALVPADRPARVEVLVGQ